MKFKKILDGNNVQGYKVCQASKQFKKMFPRRYILSLDVMGEHVVLNVDQLPNNFSIYPPVGYIFTYENSLPKWLVSEKVKYEDLGGSFPASKDKHFSNTENIDLVLGITARNRVVPPRFVNEIIVQCDSEKLMKGGLKNNTLSIVSNYLREGSFSLDNWWRSVIFNYPYNNNGLPVKYGKSISEKNINNVSISVEDIFVEYDFRAKSYEKEDEFINAVEEAFEDMNKEVEIYDNYNGLLSVVENALKKKKMKYKKVGEGDNTRLLVKAKLLNQLGLEFKITDMI